jgi:hypothetical protein
MSRQQELAKRNLYDELMELRDEQRARMDTAIKVVKGSDLPWEQNRQGKTQWYLHPMLDDVAINSMILGVTEIPPGSRTGRQKMQGGQVIFVWQGRGYTDIDGVQHHWEEQDVINLPSLAEGIVVQHVNVDPEVPARLVHAEPNFVHSIGVDMGSGFEQLEDAPEYRDQRA